MSDYSILSLLNESNDDALILEGDETLLDETDMIIEAIEESIEFDTEIEKLQFHNQDHTNNLDSDFIDDLDPDNTDAINGDTGDDTEAEAGMEVITMSEGAMPLSLLEELLGETHKNQTDLPEDEKEARDTLDSFDETDVYDSTDLDEY